MNLAKISSDYLEDALIRLAHHSTAIEGNTITLAETVSIILESTIFSKKGIRIREFYEVENHKQAFSYMLDLLENNEKLTSETVKKFHELLMDRISEDKGQFKRSQNAILGSDTQTAAPKDTPFLIMQWADNTKHRMQASTKLEEITEALAESHIQFEIIHPFSDWNGRTGRILNIFLALQNGFAPVIITKDRRAEYISLLAAEDSEELKTLFEASMTFEAERMKLFPVQQRQNSYPENGNKLHHQTIVPCQSPTSKKKTRSLVPTRYLVFSIFNTQAIT